MPQSSAFGIVRLSTLRRVLIVDDQQDSADLLAILLEHHGHEVRTASDGESALALALGFKPEVAVLDIGLPLMDGYELARRLRALPELSDCRLIALSGHCEEAHRFQSRPAGFERHLAKPHGIAALLPASDASEAGGRVNLT